jgi:histidine triad (HIT) family protein
MAQDTPFSEEQLHELSAISKLPPEQQQKVFSAFLKTLTPEQIEFLKKQQGGGCPFCLIGEGKLPAKIVYADTSFVAALDIKPANKGHVVLFPKQHHSLLTQMSDGEVKNMFSLATTLSRAVFEGMKAEGTNIFVANGGAAGQFIPHVAVHIIPRWKDDGVTFPWQPLQLDEKDFAKIHQTLSNLAANYVQPAEPLVEKASLIEYGDEDERVP